jgi:hypothetical protein
MSPSREAGHDIGGAGGDSRCFVWVPERPASLAGSRITRRVWDVAMKSLLEIFTKKCNKL